MPDQQPTTPPSDGGAPGPAATAEATIADGSERKLQPGWITLTRIVSGIAATVFSLIALIAASIVLLVNSPAAWAALLIVVAWLVFAAALGSLAWFWPAKRYRHISYRIDDQGIRIRRGVIWRVEISVPRSRIQHTDVSRGPIERSFDLATLIIHTAGTEQASISLDGLADADAFRIRDFLIDIGEDDAV